MKFLLLIALFFAGALYGKYVLQAPIEVYCAEPLDDRTLELIRLHVNTPRIWM